MEGDLKQGPTIFTQSLTTEPLGRQEMKGKVAFWVAVVNTQIFGLTCVILMVVWTAYCLKGFSWTDGKQFNYHPLFFAIGLVYLYGNAILIYRVFRNQAKFRLKIAHAVLNAGAVIFSIVALVAVFQYKKLIKGTDLYSLHSWIGIVTVALFGLQYLLGFGAFLLPWMSSSWRAKVLSFHTFFGVGIFVMALATALTGMTEKLIWTEGYSTGNFTATGVIGNCYGLFMVVFGFLVVFLVTDRRFKRQPSAEEVNSMSVNKTPEK